MKCLLIKSWFDSKTCKVVSFKENKLIYIGHLNTKHEIRSRLQRTKYYQFTVGYYEDYFIGNAYQKSLSMHKNG